MHSTKSRSNRSIKSCSSPSSSSPSSSSSSLISLDIGKNAARERSRVRSLRLAFQRLQSSIPKIPPDTKMSKLDVLVFATDYISALTKKLSESEPTTEGDNIIESKDSVDEKILHPIKKWPMRSRLYANGEVNLPAIVPKNVSLESDSGCFLLDKIEPITTGNWDPVDLNILCDDLSSLSSFPNL